jgi:hypothetical protein
MLILFTVKYIPADKTKTKNSNQHFNNKFMPAINELQIRLCVGHEVKCAKFEYQNIQPENTSNEKSRIIIRYLLLMILIIHIIVVYPSAPVTLFSLAEIQF